MSSHARKPFIPVLVVFFTSGVSALLYQIVWLKYLGLIFGNTVQAAATLIAIFLAGLGIGAFLFSRFFEQRRPLLVYAALETLIGFIGAFSPSGFQFLDEAYVSAFRLVADVPFLLALARAAGASLVLLPPTILMGGTLPILVRWWTGRSRGSGKAVSALYAANTFGATTGVALAGFALIPMVGLLATILSAVVLNFLLAIGATLLDFFRRDSQDAADEITERASFPVSVAGRTVLAASFLMGMSSIADEVFWSRIFVLHLGSSVYAYSLMLFSFLIGIALGATIIERMIGRIDLVRALGWLEVALAAALVAQIHYLTHFASVLEALAQIVQPQGYSGTVVVLAVSVLSAVLLPTALMGATFPVAVRLFADVARHRESSSVGIVYLVNTIGSIVGSFLAGFLLIPLIGSQNGLFLMAAVNLSVGLYFALERRSGRTEKVPLSKRRSWGLAVVSLLCIFGFTIARPNQILLAAGMFEAPDSTVMLFREDVTATVTLRRFHERYLSLELNGVNVAGTSADLIGTQKLQGHLPLLLHPEPKKVLHIGFGSGGTAYSVSLHPVEEIRIAELSPEVLEASDTFLRSVNRGVLEDPRVKIEINDGRNFVLATPETFDAILSDSIHPRYAGNGALYTRDYFELCRERLRPDGVISMWLPIYSLTQNNYLMIIRAFRDVFPNTTIWYVPNVPNAFTIVIGRMEEGPLPLDRLRSGLTGQVRADLVDIGMSDPLEIASMLLLDPIGVAELTRNVPPHIDDLPAVEYESGRLIERDKYWYLNFVMLVRNMSPIGRAFSGIDSQDAAVAEKQRRQRAVQHVEHLERLLELQPKEQK